MPGGVLEKHIDDSPLATGTHKNLAASAYLSDPGADFKSCGVMTDVLIKNTTDGSSGTVSAVTEDTVTGTLSGGTNNSWAIGDTYEIYITATENSTISTIWTDKSRGWRSDKVKLDRGWKPEDVDLDRDERHVFGPGQPEKIRSS
jgi:hypothetical protein